MGTQKNHFNFLFINQNMLLVLKRTVSLSKHNVVNRYSKELSHGDDSFDDDEEEEDDELGFNEASTH